MKRRSFIKHLPAMAASPFMLNHIPLQAMSASSELQALAGSAGSDRVLVIIQLHGGNDGLNTLIPINQYDRYFNLRPNIAIAERGLRRYLQLDSQVAEQQSIGLHPDAAGFKDLYERARMAIVQSVGFENMNGSHFRARDIWFTGSDSDEYVGSGWLGRYLDDQFPGFPDNYPNNEFCDPPGLELGNNVSLGFHRDNGIPMALAINNPDQFNRLISGIGVEPPEQLAKTFYDQELRWIMDIEEKSQEYAPRLSEVYERGSNVVDYPEYYPLALSRGPLRNRLAPQLQLIARLLSGGSQTRVFLARIGGFDTHIDQVQAGDPSLGNHSALLYHLSSAINAFQKDLRALGLEDRVLTMTISEFGRRAESNGSYGSDHGKAAPLFVFGKHVQPGVFGHNPNLGDLDRGNLRPEIDYRRVFAAVLQDWMGASAAAMARSRFGPYIETRLPIIRQTVTSRNDWLASRNQLYDCYPNPVAGRVQFEYRLSTAGPVKLSLLDLQGKELRVLYHDAQLPGRHSLEADLTDLPQGTYLYQLQSGRYRDSKQVIIKR